MIRRDATLQLTAILLAGLSSGCLNPFDSCPTEGPGIETHFNFNRGIASRIKNLTT